MHMIDFYEDFKAVVRCIRKTSAHATLIAGGPSFSMFSRDIMTRNPEVDFGVFLEGEETLPELVDNLDNPQKVKGIFFRHNDDIVFTGPRSLPDMEDILMPRRDIFELSKYPDEMGWFSFSVGVQSKRGCALQCTYCNYPFLSGKKVRLRNPINVVDEIQELKEGYHIDRFSFVDTVFNTPRKHAEEICKEIIRRKLQVRWSAYYNIQDIDENFLVLAKRAGCVSFEFSPDGLSKGALKGLDKGISRADIDRAVELFTNTKELKHSKIVLYFFINPPGETFFGLLQTLYFARRTNRVLKGRGTVYASWIRILPNTRLHNVAIEKGISDPQMSLLHDNYAELRKLYYSNPPLNRLDVLLRPFIKRFIN